MTSHALPSSSAVAVSSSYNCAISCWCARWLVASLIAMCACGDTVAAVQACQDVVEPGLDGWLGECQLAARDRRSTAGDVCLAGYMMTRDPGAGARAARAIQARPGVLPILEWIAAAVGDDPAGADAWLATGLARYLHNDATGSLVALRRAAAHRTKNDTIGLLHDATALLYYYQQENELLLAVAPAATAFELLEHVCDPDARAAAYLNIAALMIDIGNVPAAEAVLDRVRPIALPTTRHYAYLRKYDAQIKKAQGTPAQAVTALRDAHTFAQRDRNAGLEFNVRMDLTGVALRHRSLDEAAALLGQPPGEVASSNDIAVDAYYRAWLAYERGDDRAAVALTERALTSVPRWAMYLEDVRGRALMRLGDTRRAEQALVHAVAELERRRDAMEYDTFKSWLLAEKREPFEDLFVLQVANGRFADALETAQRATARSTLDGLLAESTEAPGIAAAGQHAAALRNLARALRESPVSRVPPIATVIERLRGHHVITYFRARRELWAIAIAGDGKLSARKVGEAGPIGSRIEALHRDAEDRHLADELGALLLPDDMMPPDGAPLYVVADDPVAGLAFAALRKHGKFIIEDHPVAYAPSAAVLSALRRTQPPLHARVFGDPTGDLPQAREEAKEVAVRLQVSPQLGDDATSAAVLAALGATLIHVAAHTKSTPIGSALLMADGTLDAGAVLDHGVAAGAVVLLTCSSAPITSRDELGALAAAFIAAGAHTVIASRWAVQDEVGRKFARAFYESDGVNDPVRAVAAAQRKLAAQGVEVAQWSTFAVIGGLP